MSILDSGSEAVVPPSGGVGTDETAKIGVVEVVHAGERVGARCARCAWRVLARLVVRGCEEPVLRCS